MRVVVVVGGEEARDVDDGDDGVRRVEDGDGAGEVGRDRAAVLIRVHAQVARQRAGAHARLHVDGERVVEFVGVVLVVVEVLEARVGAVGDGDLAVARVVRAAVVRRELAVLRAVALAAERAVVNSPVAFEKT